MYQGSVTSSIGVILNRHVPHSIPSMPAKPQKVMDGCTSRSVWELKMTSQPSFTQLSELTCQKSALDRNEGFPSGPVGLFQGRCTHHTPGPCAHVSLSSPHLYHPKPGERLHQEAGKPKSSYIHDIFHVTLENHMTSLFCL